MLSRALLSMTCTLVLGVGPALAVDVHPSDDTAQIRAAVAHGDVLPLPQILTTAQKRVPGEVLKVELGAIGDRLGYAVKILTADGHVRQIELDARTGAVVSVQND